MQALLLYSVVAILAGLVFSVVGIPLALALMPVLLVIGMTHPYDVPSAVERGIQPIDEPPEADEKEPVEPTLEWPPLVPPIYI